MDKLLYISSHTAAEIMRAQANNANNLANVNTTGFRSDYTFAMNRPVMGAGHDSRSYSTVQGAGSNFSVGTQMTTGRDLDVAVSGEGWIAVEGLDGGEAFTRAGDLRVSPDLLLTTDAGHPVVGNNGGPITIPPYEKIEIGSDGTISIRPIGQGPTTLVIVDRIKMVNPDLSQVAKGGDGLFRVNDGSIVPADPKVQLTSGTIESSNVNAVDSMVIMMELARKYEIQVKMMKTANEIDSSSQQMMKMN